MSTRGGTGWSPAFTRIYWQYPRNNFGRAMRTLWRKLDFEGFFVIFLERELSLNNTLYRMVRLNI